jgi:hypothetical protein
MTCFEKLRELQEESPDEVFGYFTPFGSSEPYLIGVKRKRYYFSEKTYYATLFYSVGDRWVPIGHWQMYRYEQENMQCHWRPYVQVSPPSAECT